MQVDSLPPEPPGEVLVTQEFFVHSLSINSEMS